VPNRRLVDVDFGPSITALIVGGLLILFAPGLVAFGYGILLRQWLIGLAGLVLPGVAGVVVFAVVTLVSGAAQGWLSRPWIMIAGLQLPVLYLVAPFVSIWVAFWLSRVAWQRVSAYAYLTKP
jgi:hypothetical protein